VSESSAPSIDNPFIINKKLQLNKGVAGAQAIMGPRMEVQGSIATGVSFGESLGSILEDYDGKFRLSSLSYGESNVSFTAKRFITIAQFNTAWEGATIEEFNTVNNQITFDEFAAIPLVRN
jgi:hypothetical protein